MPSQTRRDSDTVSLYGVLGELGEEEEGEEALEEEELVTNSAEYVGHHSRQGSAVRMGGRSTYFNFKNEDTFPSLLDYVTKGTASLLSSSAPLAHASPPPLSPLTRVPPSPLTLNSSTPLQRASPSHLSRPPLALYTTGTDDAVDAGGGGACDVGEGPGEAELASERSDSDQRPMDDHMEQRRSKEVQACRVSKTDISLAVWWAL